MRQPEDRGILLKDVLDGVAYREKGNCLVGNRGGTSLVHDMVKAKHNYAAEEVRIPGYGSTDKSRPVTWSYAKQGAGQISKNCFPGNPNKQQYDYIAQPVIKPLTEKEMEYMVRSTNGKYSDRWTYLQKPGERDKAMCLTANISKGIPYNICAEPIRIGTWPNTAKNQAHDSQQYRIYSTEGKNVTLCGNGGGMGAKTGLYAIPVNDTAEGKAQCLRATCYKDGIRNMVGNDIDRKTCVAEKTPGCAIAVEWDEDGRPIKAVSGADGKEHPVYEVMDGSITIKGKRHPIKLADGFYIIRKLTISECKRLQTVPEWFEFPVSDTQALRQLGNGWTVSVISHLIRACLEEG